MKIIPDKTDWCFYLWLKQIIHPIPPLFSLTIVSMFIHDSCVGMCFDLCCWFVGICRWGYCSIVTLVFIFFIISYAFICFPFSHLCLFPCIYDLYRKYFEPIAKQAHHLLNSHYCYSLYPLAHAVLSVYTIVVIESNWMLLLFSLDLILHCLFHTFINLPPSMQTVLMSNLLLFLLHCLTTTQMLPSFCLLINIWLNQVAHFCIGTQNI